MVMADNDFEAVSALAVASYLGPLCFAPLLTREEDEFVRFHMKQGMALFVGEAAILAIFGATAALLRWLGLAGAILVVISWLQRVFYLVVAVLVFTGVNNVIDGRQKELPVIGKFAKWIPVIGL